MGKQALAALGLCLVLGACGSADREPIRSTRAAFLAQANRVCRETTTRRERVAGLRALRPPRDADELYARWLRAEQDALAAATSLTGHSRKSTLDPEVAFAIAEGKIIGYARRLGAYACAKSAMGTIRP